MKGVQFLVDERGNKSAVLIDLKKHRDLWEDFYDRAVASSREQSRARAARVVGVGQNATLGQAANSWMTTASISHGQHLVRRWPFHLEAVL